jgi:hypothetical protein
MMEKMGYDLNRKPGLNFGKGKRTPLWYQLVRDKSPGYYQQHHRGLGYVTTPTSSDCEQDECTVSCHSSETSSWDSDTSIGDAFRTLSVNMVAVNHLEVETEDQIKDLIRPNDDPWVKHLETLWDIRFEQRDPPTEDQVVQINLGNDENPKPIFIS